MIILSSKKKKKEKEKKKKRKKKTLRIKLILMLLYNIHLLHCMTKKPVHLKLNKVFMYSPEIKGKFDDQVVFGH